MQKEYIPIMLEELDRANEIITEYLSLAKNKQSHQKPENINRIIEMILPLIQAEAVMSGKHVHVQFTDCPVVQLDDKEMRQLILNMCMNGLEAMTIGGKLTIETYPEAGHVVLLIADEGKGIEQEHLEKLGRPFFTTKDEGTGLGLAICYSIAARHQASIEVQLQPEGDHLPYSLSPFLPSILEMKGTLASHNDLGTSLLCRSIKHSNLCVYP